MPNAYDAVIIGTGQSGPFLAGRLAASGMKVAVIERKLFGGTCVNTGCIPTKTMVASAYAARMARRAAEYGVEIGGSIAVDMKRVKARKDAISGQSRTSVESMLRGMENCTVYEGHARFESAHEVSVGSTRLTAERTFINVGARAVVPQMPGLDQVAIPHEFLDDGSRFPAAALGDCGRKLHRPRVRPDVPALRQRSHDYRNGAAADPSRG